jgi:hypothetical protein
MTVTCRELERLLAAGATETSEEVVRHRAGCGACARATADIEETARLTSDLTPPAMSASLRKALLAIPSMTVSCEGAASLIAASVGPEAAESPLAPSDRSRLDYHVGRCEGCREALATLSGVSDLVEPQAAPWFPARLVVSRPAKRRVWWRALLGPRAAIGFAYGSALIVMVAGFNPADLARKAGSNLKVESLTASTTAKAASGTLADRVGAFQDRVNRKFAVLRGRAGGYSLALISNAMSLVMKTEEPAPPRSRPRNGEEKGAAPRSETSMPSIPTVRA